VPCIDDDDDDDDDDEMCAAARNKQSQCLSTAEPKYHSKLQTTHHSNQLTTAEKVSTSVTTGSGQWLLALHAYPTRQACNYI
jgi:hypothetical protein